MHPADIFPRAARHHHPLRAVSHIQQAVIVEKAQEHRQRKIRHVVQGRGPDRRAHGQHVVQGEKRGKAVLIQQVSQRIFIVMRIEQTRLAQFIKAQNFEDKPPELWLKQVTPLGKKAVQRVAVILQPAHRVTHRKTHFGGLAFNAQLFQQGNKMRIGAGVVDNKTGVDGVLFAVAHHVLRGGVPAQRRRGFIHSNFTVRLTLRQ